MRFGEKTLDNTKEIEIEFQNVSFTYPGSDKKALDPIAEHEIYSRFSSFTENKTAVYISHRLSSCVFCDRVAVFDKAKLAQTGTHNELLNKGGKYAELWNAQAQYYC